MVDHFEDKASLENALAYKIYRLARLLRYDLKKTLKRLTKQNITPEQWFMLFRLHEEDGLTQVELADKNLQDRPNVTRLLDTLEKNSLVVRAANPQDRRSYRIFLTKQGRQVVEEIFANITEERQRIFRDIDDETLASFVQTLKQIEQNIT